MLLEYADKGDSLQLLYNVLKRFNDLAESSMEVYWTYH